MCGFIAQLVEQRTGNAEVMGSNPVEALIFFRLLLSNCLNWKIHCDDHSSLSSTTAVQNELFHVLHNILSVNRCPRCKAKTLEECDQTSEMEDCRGLRPFSNVCTLEKDKGENGKYYRKCMTRSAYERSKGWYLLEKIAFCEKNECFASFW